LEGLEEGRWDTVGAREGPEGAVVGKAVRPKGGNRTGDLMKGPPTEGTLLGVALPPFCCLGAAEGCAVGLGVGGPEGLLVLLGHREGLLEGFLEEGDSDRLLPGDCDGHLDGFLLGHFDGSFVGILVGVLLFRDTGGVGREVGFFEGSKVGHVDLGVDAFGDEDFGERVVFVEGTLLSRKVGFGEGFLTNSELLYSIVEGTLVVIVSFKSGIIVGIISILVGVSEGFELDN